MTVFVKPQALHPIRATRTRQAWSQPHPHPQPHLAVGQHGRRALRHLERHAGAEQQAAAHGWCRGEAGELRCAHSDISQSQPAIAALAAKWPAPRAKSSTELAWPIPLRAWQRLSPRRLSSSSLLQGARWVECTCRAAGTHARCPPPPHTHLGVPHTHFPFADLLISSRAPLDTRHAIVEPLPGPWQATTSTSSSTTRAPPSATTPAKSWCAQPAGPPAGDTSTRQAAIRPLMPAPWNRTVGELIMPVWCASSPLPLGQGVWAGRVSLTSSSVTLKGRSDVNATPTPCRSASVPLTRARLRSPQDAWRAASSWSNPPTTLPARQRVPAQVQHHGAAPGPRHARQLGQRARAAKVGQAVCTAAGQRPPQHGRGRPRLASRLTGHVAAAAEPPSTPSA
jgi:hypothetical protein